MTSREVGPSQTTSGSETADLDALLGGEQLSLSARPRPAGGRADQWMRRIGFPLGMLVWLAAFVAPNPAGLSHAGLVAMAVFAGALVWWVTEPVPTYVTSLIVMVLLVVLRGWDATHVLGVFGMDVIWLNVLAFILSAMLVKTHLAKRLALTLIARFGRRAMWALGAFVLVQLALAPLIPATAARAALTLPLILVVAAMYGSTAQHPTPFGRNLLLLNLTGISILSSTVMTGSSANLLAVGFIQRMGGTHVYYADWLRASAPVAILTVVAAWLVGPRLLFPLTPADQTPRVAGGMPAIQHARRAMGPISGHEWRAIGIFLVVVFLWATDRYQQEWFGVELGAPIAAMIGVILALAPKIGVLDWDETNIPWHLMIFSAGAYAGGLALDSTGAAAWAMRRVFGGLALQHVAFGWTYAAVVGIMLYSHLLSTSKTVRTILLIPMIILLARQLGWPPASLALPAAFTIDWVIGLPISGKPNVILFGTNQYSVKDNLLYGLMVCTVGYALLLVAGATWFHWLGLTPAFGARI